MNLKTSVIVGALLAALSLAAQEKKKGIIAEGGDPDERASARILYWDRDADHAAGEFAIDYGRPAWKKDYEDPAKFDSLTKGKVWRMGSNFWTTLDTQLPLKISGIDVPAGSYYLGLDRSPDGSTWSLAFINPARVRAMRLDGFEVARAPILFRVPVATEKAATLTPKLTITLSHDATDIKSGTLRLAWGNVVLTAPVKVALPGAK